MRIVKTKLISHSNPEIFDKALNDYILDNNPFAIEIQYSTVPINKPTTMRMEHYLFTALVILRER